MRLLAIDTSSSAVTAAVHDGDVLLAEATEPGAQAHGELLAPVIERALATAGVSPRDLTAVVAGTGPGPFTGLRVGLVTARVMAEALGIPAYGVCSLDAIAAQAVGEGRVATSFAVATDARRKEVYLATYVADGARIEGPHVVRPADIDPMVAAGPVVGEGAWLYPDVFVDAREPGYVSAAWLASYAAARLHAGEELGGTTPLYLRRPDAVENATRKRVTPS
ncbi:MAG TPA: tRNA (adenosine(37)-N6)-threonylcarbamoyltransferase complex dimerization subunit type 1 TsaB [Candidatus Nanopelagicales bacterium]|nr:tRNA (adenosine(37)-N6)-threonylcarbamoyltransferase complex dimerization subunit type 1 TsaB [Candidatus Nanopelagicales bacterium]